MDSRDELYTVDEELAAELQQSSGGHGVVLVHAMTGYIDAGHAGELVVDHLASGAQRLVTFASDELVDLRSRRPTVTFDVSQYVEYTPHELAIDLARDTEGVPFLILRGPEPDYRWDRFIDAVIELSERFGVSLTARLHGIPMGVPHTRPVSVTTSASRSELVDGQRTWFDRVVLPAGVGNVLEYRLGQLGRDAVGLAVHVPHYLAQSRYTPAGIALLERLHEVSGLAVEVSDLAEAAAQTIDEVAQRMTESVEVASIVKALEQQYDAYTAHRGGTNLLADATDLPSADELAAEFEKFLAEQRPDGAS